MASRSQASPGGGHRSIAHLNSDSRQRIGYHCRGLYISASSSEYLVKTGAGIKDMKWGRTFWRFAGQNVASVDMKPRNIAFNLHSISKDLVPFDVPVTFTIQVHDPHTDEAGFLRYAQRINNLTEAEYYTILTGIIHGQTRILAGTLDVMEIFNGRDAFRMKVQQAIEKELIPFGCSVINANISELRDMPGEDNKYFESLKAKAISAATQEARVQVAENMRKGDVGTREKEAAAQTAMTALNTEAATRLAQLEADAQINQANIKSQSNVAANKASVEAKMKVALLTGEQNSRQAQIDADNLYASQKASIEARTKVAGLEAEQKIRTAAIVSDAEIKSRQAAMEAKNEIGALEAENLRQQNQRSQAVEESNNQLKLVQIQYAKEQACRQQEADMAPQQKQMELDVELRKVEAQRQTEFLRGTTLAQAIVEAEAAAAQAEGAANAMRIDADAHLYSRQRAADADAYQERQKAEADLYANLRRVEAEQREADASLFASQRQAEGILAVKTAEAEGLGKLLAACKDPDLVKYYLALEHDLFSNIAGHLAGAVQGLQPKINIWTTGGGSEGASDSMAPLRNLFTSLPPLMDAVGSQAGMRMPSWMPQMPNGEIDHQEAASSKTIRQ